jgi:hypothetical protein
MLLPLPLINSPSPLSLSPLYPIEYTLSPSSLFLSPLCPFTFNPIDSLSLFVFFHLSSSSLSGERCADSPSTFLSPCRCQLSLASPVPITFATLPPYSAYPLSGEIAALTLPYLPPVPSCDRCLTLLLYKSPSLVPPSFLFAFALMC